MPFKLPQVLTSEEQEALLKQPNPRYYSPHRNRVMLKLFLDSGLRRGELRSLTWGDICLMTGKLHVWQGKGARDRVLWIGDDTLAELRGLRDRQAALLKGVLSDQDWRTLPVFTSRFGNPLTPDYISETVRRYGKLAGIPKRVTPHILRHTFATDLLRATKNIRVVQKALGHASLQNTQIYTHIVDEELDDAMRGFRQKAKEGGGQRDC